MSSWKYLKISLKYRDIGQYGYIISDFWPWPDLDL